MMRRRPAVILAALTLTIAAVAAIPTQAAQAINGAPCTWTVNVPSQYHIGSTVPNVSVTGTCASNPNSQTKPENWHLTSTINTGTPIDLAFQGCNFTYFDQSTKKCHNLSNPGVEYTYAPTLPLNITAVGDYTTAQNPSSYAYDSGDTNGYALNFTATPFSAKYSTQMKLTITASGTKHWFTMSPLVWSPSAKNWVKTYNTYMYLQRIASGHWVTYKAFKPSTNPYTYVAYFSSAYHWRITTLSTATSWGSTSVTVFK